MSGYPGFPIGFEVDQFARRPVEVVPIRIARWFGRALHQIALRIQVDHSGYFLWQRTPGKNGSAQFHQALLRLSHQNEVAPFCRYSFA